MTKKWKKKKIRATETHADEMISVSFTDSKCKACKKSAKPSMPQKEYDKCELIKTRASTFNNHICGFSCHKRKKTLHN